MPKSVNQCQAELIRLGWTVYEAFNEDFWTVSARLEGEVCTAQGPNPIAVWNEVLEQALKSDGDSKEWAV